MTRVLLARPGDLGPAEIAAWHRMQELTPSLRNPFLSPEFAISAGRYRPGSRVGVLTGEQGTVGFFPFEMRRLGAGVPISGWLSASQGVVHAPDARWSVGELLRGCGLSAWRFDNLIADQEPFTACRSAVVPTPVIDLAGGFTEYYAKLRARSPRMCRELERKRRKLDREVGQLRLECDSPDPALLQLLIAWKSEQYRRTKVVDTFALPWAREFFAELFATRTSHLSGMLSVLYAGDQPVSIQFGLRSGSQLVGWYTGYDGRFGRYSPGIIQITMMAEQLASIGVETLHMGKGARRFADVLKNGDVFVGEGTAASRTLAGAAHRLRNAASFRALRIIREHTALHHAADLVLRRSGISSRTYGRI